MQGTPALVSSLSNSKLFPSVALGSLNPAATYMLCLPWKGSWRVLVWREIGVCGAFMGDELLCQGHAHPHSCPLQPQLLNLCVGDPIIFSGRYPGSQFSKDWAFTGKVAWPNTGVKDISCEIWSSPALGSGMHVRNMLITKEVSAMAGKTDGLVI